MNRHLQLWSQSINYWYSIHEKPWLVQLQKHWCLYHSSFIFTLCVRKNQAMYFNVKVQICINKVWLHVCMCMHISTFPINLWVIQSIKVSMQVEQVRNVNAESSNKWKLRFCLITFLYATFKRGHFHWYFLPAFDKILSSTLVAVCVAGLVCGFAFMTDETVCTSIQGWLHTDHSLLCFTGET